MAWESNARGQAASSLPPQMVSSNLEHCGAGFGGGHTNSPFNAHNSTGSVGFLDASKAPPGSASHASSRSHATPPNVYPSVPPSGSVSVPGSHASPPIVNWSMPPHGSSMQHGPPTHAPQTPQSHGYHTNPANPFASQVTPSQLGEPSWCSTPAAGTKPATHGIERPLSASVPPMHPGSPGSWVGGAWGIRPDESPAPQQLEEEELPRPRSAHVTATKDLPLASNLESRGERDEAHLAVNEHLCKSMDFARLERSQLSHQTEQLDRQLAHLERIVSCIVSRPEKAQEGEQIWQWGARDYEDKFVTEATNGYYVDKTHVSKREDQLARHRAERGEHRFIDWLAGKSDRRIAAEAQVLEEQAWRNLYQFGEIERDAFRD